ncbi:MAG: dihydrodipicolinate reductase [Nitrososphaerota archaeon]|nr:dihydrodipicolinate reductase [Nitrososphaerota archaeon]
MKKLKVISFGLGPIGRSIAALALSRPSELELVGAVDSNPELVGKDLSELLNLPVKTGIKVAAKGESLYNEADAVLHATSSFLSVAKSQLLEFCNAGIDVVSTNEELSYPWIAHREIALELDSAAKKGGSTLLGTGVNPGFVMDALAVTLSGVCANVSKVKVTRILDATKRRLPFQKKVGIGMTVEEFQRNVETGRFGHIGLPESIAMTCAALGVTVDRIDQRVSPKIALSEMMTEHFGLVEKGRVLGLVQDADGYANGKQVASYHIEMYASAEDPRDEIELFGEPNIKLRIPGGTPGDIATAAIIVNSVPRVVESAPGLMTVKDLRPASSLMCA